MHEFWYNNVKPKYNEDVNLFYMDTNNLIVHKKKIFTKILQKMVNKGLIQESRIRNQKDCFPKEKEVIALMKNELDREITKEFEGLRAKKYGYLTDDNDETKLKRTKKKETKI